ncbi:MAG: MBL fold metallo-hydrolase [bacterium]|nr:MBL fold metallo-hydrolase [bacterium]
MIDHLQTIVPGLFLVEAENGGRAPLSHSCVVRGDTEVLIDAGCGIGRMRELTKVWKPELTVISHSHPDHCSGLWLVDESRILSPIQRSEIFWKLEPMAARLVPREMAAGWIKFVERLGLREVDADGHYDDGHKFDFGNIKLECIHTPGHADDHYVFFEPTHGLAMIFDIDLTSFGPWYGNPECDIDLFLDAIRRVAELRPKIVFSSHKGVIKEDIDSRLRKYAAVVEKRDASILSLLSEPRTLAELVDRSPIHGKHPLENELLRHFEGVMIEKHLARMERRGDVEREQDRWRRR